MRKFVNCGYAMEGPAYQYQGDDGYPKAVIIPVLVAQNGLTGKMYQLPNKVDIGYNKDGEQRVKLKFTLEKAREMLEVITSRAWIESDYWVEVSEQDIREYLDGNYNSIFF